MQRTITSIATPVPICTSSFAETLEWKGKKLVNLALIIRVFSQQFQLTFSTCTRFLYMYLYLYYGIISSTLIVLSTPSRCHQAQPPPSHTHTHTLSLHSSLLHWLRCYSLHNYTLLIDTGQEHGHGSASLHAVDARPSH